MRAERLKLAVADGSEMRVHIVRPSATKPRRGMIILQEAFGVTEFIKNIQERFAAQGYLTIAPELFHRTAPPGFVGSYTEYATVHPHMQALSDECLAADMRASLRWLVHEGASRRNIAALGFCMGGRAAFLANIELPVAAAVSFYGGGIAEALTRRASELHGPQLLIWGGEDSQIGRDTPRRVADVLADTGRPFVEIVLAEAGHGFANYDRDGYHAPSARIVWPLVDAFLAEYV